MIAEKIRNCVSTLSRLLVWKMLTLTPLWITSTLAQPASAQQPTSGAPAEFEALWRKGRTWTRTDLIRFSRSTRQFEREFAIMQLGDLVDENQKLLPILIGALRDPDRIVALLAVASLTRLGPWADAALIGALSDARKSSIVARSHPNKVLAVNDLVFAVLQRRPPGTAALVRGFKRLRWRARPEDLNSARSATKHGSAEGARISSTSPLRRLLLLTAKTKPDSPEMLATLLSDSGSAVQEAVLLALLRADEVPVTLFPILDRIERSRSGSLQLLALSAIARSRHQRAQERLFDQLSSSNLDARKRAVAALDPVSKEFPSLLGKALRDRSAEVREWAIARAATPDRGPIGNPEVSPGACSKSTAGADATIEVNEEVLGLMLAERHRAPARPSFLADALKLVACNRPALAARIISELHPELSAPKFEVREFAVDVLGPLADDGAQIDISSWLRGAGEVWSAALQAFGNDLLTNGRFDGAALDQFLIWHRANPDPRDPVGAYRALAKNDRMAGLIGDRVRSLLATRGWHNPEEATLAVLGLPASSRLPDVLEAMLQQLSIDEMLSISEALFDLGFRSETLHRRLIENLKSARSDLHSYARSGLHSYARAAKILVELPESRSLIIDLLATAPIAAKRAVISAFGKDLPIDGALAAAIAAAAPDLGAETIATALTILANSKERVPSIIALLRSAIAHDDPRIRERAAEAWLAHRLPIGEEINRLLADAEPQVRQVAILLIPQVDDEQVRLRLVIRALRDNATSGEQNAGVVLGGYRHALAAAAGSGPRAVKLANDYLAGTSYLDADDIMELGVHSRALSPGLLARLEQSGAGVKAQSTEIEDLREGIIEALGKNADDLAIRLRLTYYAVAGKYFERGRASRALVEGGFEIGQSSKGIAAALTASCVTERAKEWIARAFFDLYGQLWRPIGRCTTSVYTRRIARDKASAGSFLRVLPPLLWPPPSGFRDVVVPRALLPDARNLGQVQDVLVSVLRKSGGSAFEWSVFGNVPNGFALVARMERIRQDGSPFPPPHRWTEHGRPHLSTLDTLSDLFFEKPGYFRVIAFVITDQPNFDSSGQAKKRITIGSGRHLPDAVRKAPFGPDHQLVALVYTYERKRGDPEFVSWGSGSPSAEQHLTAAGVWPKLEK